MTIELRYSEASGGYASPLLDTESSPTKVAPRGRVRARTIAWFVGGISVLALAYRVSLWWLAAMFSPASTVDMVMDDAYYYLQIAFNLGETGLWSFDGITETNGYQPLWMALLAGLQLVFGFSKHKLFAALQGLVTVVLALPLLYCLKRGREPFFLALAAGLAGGYAVYPHVFSCGMETALFAPALVAVCALVQQGGFVASSTRVGFVFAVAVMIRLDGASLLVAYALPLAYASYKAEGPRNMALRLAKFFAPAAATLLVYGVANWLAFGEATPISGLAKRLGAPLFSNWGIVHYYLLHGVPVVMGLVGLLGMECLWTKFEGARFHYTGLFVLSVAVLVHYVFFASFTGWIPWPWYFYAFAMMMVLIVARFLEIALALASPSSWSTPRFAQLAALIAVALPTVPFATLIQAKLAGQVVSNERQGGVPTGSFNRRNVADAMEFSRSGKPMVVAIGDRAAGLGYWSEPQVQVFPLEGLVANKAYLEARKRGEGEAWVQEHIKPALLIIDREDLVPVRIGDEERYVVIEPIQGRVVLEAMMVYCFPMDAVVRQQRARDDQPTVIAAPALRVTFDMQKAEACTGPFAEYVQQQLASHESLRRTAVGVEYSPALAGGLNHALEQFDRKLALRTKQRSH